MKQLASIISFFMVLAATGQSPVIRFANLGSFNRLKSHSSVYNMNRSYVGSFTYENRIYSGNVKLKSDSLSVGDNRFYIFDKGISRVDVSGEGNRMLIQRLGKDKLLYRVVLDTMEVQVYDLKIFDFKSKVEKSSMLIRTSSGLKKFPNSIFRSKKWKIRTLIKQTGLNSEQKEFLEKWLHINT
jgi:hypothetical protein